MLAQRGVRAVFEMAEGASLKIVGIGSVEPHTQLVSSGMIEPRRWKRSRPMERIRRITGHFFDATAGCSTPR